MFQPSEKTNCLKFGWVSIYDLSDNVWVTWTTKDTDQSLLYQFSRYDWTKKIWEIYLEGTHEREVVQKDVRFLQTRLLWINKARAKDKFLGFESFLWEKKLKRVLRSFPRDSSTWFVDVRWLLFCLYPNSEPYTLHIAEIFRFFPEVDLARKPKSRPP